MIGSGIADFISRTMIGSEAAIRMTIYESPINSELWLFVLLGLLFSVIGFLYNKLLFYSLDFFGAISRYSVVLTGIGVGLLIALFGLFSPDLIGGGYETITNVLEHSFTVYALLGIFVIRFLLSVFSYGSGVPGGIFAPLLALGVISGMLYAIIMQHYFPDLISHPGVFAVAGMAAIFAAVVRAPLTGLVLAIEMTSNFELILPLIVATVTASVVTAMLGNQPVYSTLLKRTLANDN
jgi:CIC family chloride channel protein